MSFYRSVGSVPPKRHTQHRDPEGRLYHEELMGEEGFSSDSSLLYHRGVPSAIVDSQVWELPDQTPYARTTRSSRGTSSCTRSSPSRRRRRLPRRGAPDGARQQRRPPQVRRHRHRPLAALPQRDRRRVRVRRVRDRHGRDRVRCACPTAPRTTCSIPRATTIAGCPAEPSRLYPIEANSHIAPPKRYLSRFGQLLEHAPYCERDLHGPGETSPASRGPTSRCW